jgi:hypothetical protein
MWQPPSDDRSRFCRFTSDQRLKERAHACARGIAVPTLSMVHVLPTMLIAMYAAAVIPSSAMTNSSCRPPANPRARRAAVSWSARA